jgi:hypothetical protein
MRLAARHLLRVDGARRVWFAGAAFAPAAERPPMLLTIADKDFAGLPGMAEAFAKDLTKAKCEVTAKEFKDRTHITIMSDMKKADDPLFLAAREFILKVSK